MDALSDVLRTTRLSGGVFLHAEFSDPWCLRSAKVMPQNCGAFVNPRANIVPYHYVLEGTLRVKLEDVPALELPPGGVVLFPRNEPHLLGGDLALRPTPTEEVVERATDGRLAAIRLGGGGARTRIVCGFLACEQTERNPVLSTLPPALSFESAWGGSADWVRSSFTYAAEEIAAGRAGAETVLAKLSELLFVDAVRRYVEEVEDGQTGWLAGLKDPYVSRALALLHARLDHAWTVDELGREIGLSRSALAERFGEVIGLAPMQYLTSWRMQVAAQALRNSSKSILQIAQEVGYESEAAFSRAFKRVMQRSPGKWRRELAGGRAS